MEAASGLEGQWVFTVWAMPAADSAATTGSISPAAATPGSVRMKAWCASSRAASWPTSVTAPKPKRVLPGKR